MSIEWNKQTLDLLGAEFLQQVISNVGGGEKSTIQFGTMGDGYAPNYQVNQVLEIWGTEKKQVLIFNGRSHNEWTKEDTSFKKSNLSTPFNMGEIKEILESF